MPRTSAPATIASRLDASRMQTVGTRGYLDELLGAFDSTLVPLKLRVALVAGLAFGGLAALALLPVMTFALSPPGWGWLLVGVGILVFAWMTGILTQVTVAELSQMRPGRWDDLRENTSWLVIRLSLLVGIYLLALVGLLALSRATSDWIVANTALDYGPEYLNGLQALTVLVLFVGVVMVPLLLPLAPLLIVERCSIPSAGRRRRRDRGVRVSRRGGRLDGPPPRRPRLRGAAGLRRRGERVHLPETTVRDGERSEVSGLSPSARAANRAPGS